VASLALRAIAHRVSLWPTRFWTPLPWQTRFSRPDPGLRGIFVTGTDTGVGKSVLAAAVCAALAERGERVAAFKPVVTGLDEPAGVFPHDHWLLAGAANAGQSPEEVAPYRYGPPVSPHFAAQLAGEKIEPAVLVEAARRAGAPLVCEGVGGLLVPITTGYLVGDLAVDLGLPVVIAARTGLGTINHTLLTVEAARTAGLEVAAVVLTPWPSRPEPIEVSNRETIGRLAAVPVADLPPTDVESLAAAGRSLPLDDWL
jgi:dethiobiotin synthetase